MAFAIRYLPGSDLARRWPEPAGDWALFSDAQRVLAACVNANQMEIVEVETK